MTERIETEVDGLRMSLSHLERPLFADGFTKGELIAYYLQVADVILPHLASRALTRVRYPHGTQGESFYEKNVPAGAPPWVETISVQSVQGHVNYVHAYRRADLVWLANLATIELHTPQWRVQDAPPHDCGIKLEGPRQPHATSLLIDLDPGPEVSPKALASAALLVATALAEAGLECFPKTSGNKGLQLYAPIAATPATLVVSFVQSLAHTLAQRHPQLFVATITKAARSGRIYLDYAQNLPARNTIVAYSMRGMVTPSISTPLTWEEVAAIAVTGVPRFTPAQLLARLDAVGDVWAAVVPTPTSPALRYP